MIQNELNYELVLGDSLLGQPAEYCTLRYRDDFKPSNACRSGTGTLCIKGSQVALALPDAKDLQSAVQFDGMLEHSKDAMDCVLLFEGDGFRLEALAAHVHNLRHVRTAGTVLEAAPLDLQPSSAPAGALQITKPLPDSNNEGQTAGSPSPALSDAAVAADPRSVITPSGGSSSSSSSGTSSSSSSSSDSASDSAAAVSQQAGDAIDQIVKGPASVQLNDDELQFLGLSGQLTDESEFI